MTFKNTKNKVLAKKLIGLSIVAPSILSSVISLLKMIYFRLDDGSQLAAIIVRPFKEFVSFAYGETRFLSLFWEHSPTPNQMDLSEPDNIYFIAIYVLVFVGFAFLSSGKKLGSRLAKINEKIDEQLIEESIKGVSARSRQQIEQSTEIPSSSIFLQLHQLYVAPIVTAIIVALLIKVLGL